MKKVVIPCLFLSIGLLFAACNHNESANDEEQSQTETEMRAQTGTEAQTLTGAETQTPTDAKAQTQTGSQTQTQSGAKTQTQTQSGSQTQTQAGTKTQTQAMAGSKEYNEVMTKLEGFRTAAQKAKDYESLEKVLDDFTAYWDSEKFDKLVSTIKKNDPTETESKKVGASYRDLDKFLTEQGKKLRRK